MRYLILADLHGNHDALEAVLADAARRGHERPLVLGDLVGYGACPNRVVETVRRLAAPEDVIRGNHDKVVAEIDDGTNFNSVALAAARWTRERMSPENLDYVRELPSGPVAIDGDLAICHGSPRDEDEYLLSIEQAHAAFEAHPARLTFFGHTHLPMVFVGGEDEEIEVALLQGGEGSLELDPARRYLFNPGSVGQPRDRDARASYAIYDSEEGRIEWRRVRYPVARAQERIRQAGLPDVLAYRLGVGI